MQPQQQCARDIQTPGQSLQAWSGEAWCSPGLEQFLSLPGALFSLLGNGSTYHSEGSGHFLGPLDKGCREVNRSWGGEKAEGDGSWFSGPRPVTVRWVLCPLPSQEGRLGLQRQMEEASVSPTVGLS